MPARLTCRLRRPTVLAVAFFKIGITYTGVWGGAPIGFPEGENRYRPGPAGGTGLGNRHTDIKLYKYFKCLK